ncbi:MAG: DUF4369 domain-containing protein [Fermentimonas sp.]|jgi:hypothetical protein
MLRYSHIVFIVLYLLIAVSCNKSEYTLIKGEIENLELPYIISTHQKKDSLVVDTIEVSANGKFSYKAQIDSLTVFSLYMNNNDGVAVVFADKGNKIKVKGDATLPDLIRVKGSEINDDLTNFKDENSNLLEQRGQLIKNIQLDQSLEVGEPSGSSKMAHKNNVNNLNLLNHELMLDAEEYIKEHPDKFSSLILINNFFVDSDNPAALERVLGYIGSDLKKSHVARRLKSYSDRLNTSAEGKTVPYFRVMDKDSVTLTPNNFRGKYLLLSFVSSDNQNSRENIDLLKHEYELVDKDSVEFVSVYIDSDDFPIEYNEQDSIPWKIVEEKDGWGSEIVKSLNVQYLPFNMLVAPDGKIKMRNISAPAISEEIGKKIDEEDKV